MTYVGPIEADCPPSEGLQSQHLDVSRQSDNEHKTWFFLYTTRLFLIGSARMICKSAEVHPQR